MTLFQRKNFVLKSGKETDWKIEADSLTIEDLDTLALLISKKYEFSKVYGVPTGAVRFAKACEPYCKPGHPTLIVEDVVTTGGSMERYRKELNLTGDVIGVSIFARGTYPDWIHPMFIFWD